MAARLTLAGATAAPEEWAFAPDEAELVRISVEDDPVAIKRRDAPGLLRSKLFTSAWREWGRFKRFGLPHGAGWKKERGPVIRVIEAFEQEFEDYQAELME